MLKKGDMIKCSDKDEAVEYFMQLHEAGYEADFCYEKDGQKGIWIEIEEVPK